MLSGGYADRAGVGMVPVRGGASRFHFSTMTLTGDEDNDDTEQRHVLVVTDAATGMKYAAFETDLSRPMVVIIRQAGLPLAMYHVHDGIVTAVRTVSELEVPRLVPLLQVATDRGEFDDYNEQLTDAEPYAFVVDLRDNGSFGTFNRVPRLFPHDLQQAQVQLAVVNTWVQSRCPALTFRLDYLSQQPGVLTVYSEIEDLLTLCLYVGNHCASSITCSWYEDDPDTLTIASATHTSQRQKGWNNLCRAALVFVAGHIRVGGTPITKLQSVAVNPLSAYTLVKSYVVEVDAAEQEAGVKQMTLPQLQAYFAAQQTKQRYYSMEISIPLSEANRRAAEAQLRAGKLVC